MKKTLLSVLAVAVVVGGGAFCGGMKYQESKASKELTAGEFQNLRNLSAGERQQRLQELGTNTGGFRDRAGGQQGNGFVSGEIVVRDGTSITIKLRDGGSKIIFYSNTTEIGKLVEGASSDLEIGKTVSVNGKANSDGSITAQSIQMRPEGINPSR